MAELGVCSAARTTEGDGLNGGKNGGRICWAVAGTFCGGEVQGEFAHKIATCLGCDFFQIVRSEEGGDFRLMLPGQVYKEPTKR